MIKHPRQNSRYLPLLALLALCLVITPATAAPLRLIYGNDNMGELDGCG